MSAFRKVPEFYSPGAIGSFTAGVFMIPGVLFLFILILFAGKKSFGDWIGFSLVLILEFVAFIFTISSMEDGFSKLKRKRVWVGSCATARTTIVKREGNVRYTDDYYKYGPFWSLDLEMIPDQREKCPGESIVSANISKGLYRRYAHKDTIRVYYYPSDPLVFLLEGEI